MGSLAILAVLLGPALFYYAVRGTALPNITACLCRGVQHYVKHVQAAELPPLPRGDTNIEYVSYRPRLVSARSCSIRFSVGSLLLGVLCPKGTVRVALSVSRYKEAYFSILAAMLWAYTGGTAAVLHSRNFRTAAFQAGCP